MDSKSPVASTPSSSLGKGARSWMKGDQFSVGTYNDSHSASHHCISYLFFSRPQLRVDSHIEALPEDAKEQRPVSSSLQEGDLFYNSLIVSGGKQRPRNHWAVVISVILLSLLLSALVLLPLFQTDPLPERATLTMLYVPPAAPASNAATFPVSPYTSRSTPVNTRIPALHRAEEAPTPLAGIAGGIVGGVPGGVVGGIPGGILADLLRGTGSAPVLAAPLPAPKRTRVPARIAEANLVYDVAPKYPPEAGRARIEGTVVLMAVIAKDGSVRDVRVESGLPLLAQAAIEAVKQWRYRPYLLNGEPVEVDSLITINFTLSKG